MAQAASSWRSRARACRPIASSTSGGLAQVVGAQHRLQPFGLGVDAALAAGAAQQRAQLGRGQPGRRAGGRGGGEHRAGFGSQQAAALAGEGREDGRVVLAQQ